MTPGVFIPPGAWWSESIPPSFPSERFWPLKRQRGTSVNEAWGPKILAFCEYKEPELLIAKCYKIRRKINYLEILFYFF